MGSSEPLKAALAGYDVDPERLKITARHVEILSEQWDRAITGYLDNTIAPLVDRSAHTVDANPHGRFDQATNLHDDVSAAHRALRQRTAAVGALLRQLAQGTDAIADRYDRVEQLNAADQHKLLTLLDSGLAPAAPDPTGDPT